MYYWRVTKYNPIYRKHDGRYTREEWTAFSDIGNCYEGKKFTFDDYLFVESAYIEVIISAMKEAEIKNIRISDLEKIEYTIVDKESDSITEALYNSLKEGMNILIDDVNPLMKLILREQIWGKLESNSLEVHFGYDYYMYIYSKKRLEKTEKTIREKGLFVEDMKSLHIDI